MFKLSCLNKVKNSNAKLSPSITTCCQKTCILIVSSTVLFGLSACGQKGELYLADTSSQTITSSSEVLESTSNPQDAAFATIDDDDYQKERYLEQKQVLPGVSDDPNDY